PGLPYIARKVRVAKNHSTSRPPACPKGASRLCPSPVPNPSRETEKLWMRTWVIARLSLGGRHLTRQLQADSSGGSSSRRRLRPAARASGAAPRQISLPARGNPSPLSPSRPGRTSAGEGRIHVRQDAFVVPPQIGVAFAGLALQLAPVDDGDRAAALLDRAALPEPADDTRGIGPPNAEHLRNELLRHPQLPAADAVLGGQKPARQARVE